MEEKTLSHKIVRNTIFNIIGNGWGILIAIFLTPYIIKHIGVDRFGIWAVVGILTGYFGLLDFGISTSFVKYISEFYTKKDYVKINQIINTGVTFYCIFAVIIISIGFVLINPILRLLSIPVELYGEARFAFSLGIIIFCIFNAFSSFGAIQGGLQRMDISNKVAIAISVPQVIGTIIFLKLGYGLPGLMVNNALILIISSIVNIVIAFKILPELRLNPFLLTKEMFKKLFGFGYKLQIAKISSITSVQIDKLLITYFLSIGLVAYFQLGSTIVEKAKSLVLLFLTALIPAFSEIDARGEREKLIEGYTRGTKYLGLIAIPLFTFIIISAHHIMMAWMGPGYEKSTGIIQVLCVGWLFAVLSGMRAVIVQAIAKPEFEMKAGLLVAILNIPLSIIFIVQFGFMGVAIGTSLSLFIAAIYIFIKFQQLLHLPVWHFIKITILKTTIICICIGLPLWRLTSIFQGVLFEHTRIASLIILVINALMFFAVYLTVLSYLKPLDNIDMTLLKDKLSFLKPLILKFRSENIAQQINGRSK
ncbi:MAG: oligosaccharide flippase family protein [Planctomycetes bacterium]|nr:oligosaccharide flippase family protein [Planctomycetota bacterium]